MKDAKLRATPKAADPAGTRSGSAQTPSELKKAAEAKSRQSQPAQEGGAPEAPKQPEPNPRKQQRDLQKRSARGDKDATYALNEQAGTKGARAENAVMDQRGDTVVKAGERIKTSKTNTEIDVETRTEVIEVKSGDLRHYAGEDQLAKQAEYAQSVGKEHVLAYDKNIYPDPAHPDLQAIRAQQPGIKLEGWDF